MVVTFPSPIPELQHAPLPLQSAVSQGTCPDSLLFHYFLFELTFESLKELGARQIQFTTSWANWFKNTLHAICLKW